MQPHNPEPLDKRLPSGVSPDIFSEDPQPSEHHVPTGYGPRTGVKLGVGAVLVFVILGVGFILVQLHRDRAVDALARQTAADVAAPAPVDVVAVKYAPMAEPLTLPGETRAWYESTIYARVSGYVEKWFVDIGDPVKEGQALASIETPELDAQLTAARAKLNAAEAEVKVQEAATVFAKTTYDRWQGSPKGVVSEQERESKKAEYDSSVARLTAAQAQVNLSQADVESLVAQTKFKQVTAPYDGVITARRIDIGDLVTAGSTAATTSLYSIAQSDKMRIFIDVPQSASTDVSIDMPAVAVANDFPDRKFEGKVSRTAHSIDPISRTLKVEVDVTNTDLKLLPGMYVQVSFNLLQKPLLEVPASAMLFRASGPEVAVIGDDDRASFRGVVIARDQGDVVEIRSGISVNQKVALNLSSQVADGDEVKPIDVDQPSSGAPGKPSTVTSAAPR